MKYTSIGNGCEKSMERTPCGMQKKPKIFWVNIKSKGAWSPGLAAGGGAAFQPCLLSPTITTQQRPNKERELVFAFLLRVLWAAYHVLVCLGCWLLPLRTTSELEHSGLLPRTLPYSAFFTPPSSPNLFLT